MMGEIHPSAVELALLSEELERSDTELTEHLRWCTRCRSIIADHQWLQEQVSVALTSVVDAVPIPQPKWWAVQESLFVNQRRHVAGWRLSAVVSVVLSLSLMLSISPVLGTAAMLAQTAQISSPVAIVATAPSKVDVVTPTPVVYCETQLSVDWSDPPTVSTPVLVLPPTPPQSDI